MQFHRLAKVLPGPQVLAFLVRVTFEMPRELLRQCHRSQSQSQTPGYCEAANKAEKVKKTFNMLLKDIYFLILGRKCLWIQFYLFVSDLYTVLLTCAVKKIFCTHSLWPMTLERLNGKTSFQSHIVEHHKSYGMVLESWESIEGNLNVPLFARETECLQMACTKPIATELMNVSGLYNLNEQN